MYETVPTDHTEVPSDDPPHTGMIEMARSSATTADSPGSGDPLLQLRLAELTVAEAFMRPLGTGPRVLEVGAGSGHQAAALTAELP